jgi:catechol 2,3-dioxygenase-like lactoylglutathione lyase family enzyme
MNIKGINRVIVAVKDIEQSKTYYTKVLGASFLRIPVNVNTYSGRT